MAETLRPPDQRSGFGTFAGVARPTALTILGAMLYLREGWVVGQAGVLGALAILGFAASITGATALSLASVASNVRVRPGGAFAIISQALGLEAGGAIGVPLYLAQAASSAMYVYAFTEAWATLFPTHPAGVVAAIAYGGLALVAWRSSGLAMRAQAWMLGIVGLALSSALLGVFTAGTLHAPTWVGSFTETTPMRTFAIFFPAVTGIMVGAGMSGSLADPRRSIPRGTLWAWAVTTAVYALFVGVYAVLGTPEELSAQKTLLLDRAAVPALVVGGLLVSTLMAALSSLVAAPRLLQAMAAHEVVPGSRWLAKVNPAGEPGNAVLATTALGALGLAAGSLDAIAPVITSFFVMTYLAINAVVYTEQMLGMISFRPSFRIPAVTPLVGVALCLVALAVSSPFGALAELALVVGIYAAIARRQIDTPWETVRSGIVVTVAAWAARRAAHIQRSERAWKPDLLVPVAHGDEVELLAPVAEDLARRNGSIRWVGVGPAADLAAPLEEARARGAREGLYVSTTQLRTEDRTGGVILAIDALRASLFPPNLLLLDAAHLEDDEQLSALLAHCDEVGVGVALRVQGPSGRPRAAHPSVHVWLSDRSPDWALELRLANLDLPVLVAYLVAQAWDASLCLHTVVRDPADRHGADSFLRALVDQARLPAGTAVQVSEGDFHAAVEASEASLAVLGLSPVATLASLHAVRDRAGCPCLFLLDSGQESALA